MFLVNPYLFITEWHRAISHSLLLVPVWALLLGFLTARIFNRQTAWAELSGLFALGLVVHILFDVITVYGTQIFAPFGEQRLALGLSFNADLYLAAITWISLAASLWRRWLSRWGIAAIAIYIAIHLVFQQQALRVARLTLKTAYGQIHALPQPLSPFFWKLVIENGNRYSIAYLDNRPAGWPVERVFGDLVTDYRPADQLLWHTLPRYPRTKTDRDLAHHTHNLQNSEYFPRCPLCFG